MNFPSTMQADFDRFLCHDELFLSMKPLTGLLRENTPTKLNGTVGSDMKKLVRRRNQTVQKC